MRRCRFGAVNRSIEASGRVELSIDPAGPVGWRASFPRFRVGGARGLLAIYGIGKNRTLFYLNGRTETAKLRKRSTLFYGGGGCLANVRPKAASIQPMVGSN